MRAARSTGKVLFGENEVRFFPDLSMELQRRRRQFDGGTDPAARQQQPRPPQKLNSYQNAMREIRKSLMPFANDLSPASSSTHTSGDVNRQMLQDLLNMGCDQVRGDERYPLHCLFVLWGHMLFQ
ncbi:hypothetical protein AAFF_G00290770 [Aldrovandia affinis]|uniref:Uncharacterized protein n=1 Tax=Aldrovandia affinis TaxID=143900 RepID=A0AAD7R994_9TELE|nr:hypothetical protein AAFF_G00290770 [Aldrovandia affinis]